VDLLDPHADGDREPLATRFSDGGGYFAFEVPSGREYEIASRLGDLVAGCVVGRKRDLAPRVQPLHLLPSVSVAGLVTCGGRPAAGVEVDLRCAWPRQHRTTRTDGFGRYRFGDVERYSGCADVDVAVRGSAWWVGPAVRVRVTFSDAGEVVAAPIDVAEIRVRGHVRDEAGRPIVRAVVGVPGQGAAATTDAEGAYEFVGLGTAMPLQARAPGYVPDPTPSPEPEDGSTRDFVLRRGGTLFGRLVGERVASVGLILDAPDSTWFVLGITNADGSWVAEDVPGAPIRLRLHAGDGEPVALEGLVPDSVVPDVVLRKE
jgi:hypothetical protein